MTTFTRLDTDAGDHWSAHARQWSRIGSPLRPHGDDIAAMRYLLRGQLSAAPDNGRGCCGLALGATPELTQLGADMIAIDLQPAMIDMSRRQTHWATNANEAAACHLIRGNWLSLPFAAHAFDFAAGDGSFNLLRYPQDYHLLFTQLRRVLKPTALAALRIFMAPLHGETCAALIAEAYAGNIGSFHAFKWRFAMALVARNRNANIGVADIYREFNAWIPDRIALSASTGWPISAIDTIDVYRNSPAVYSFPTAEEWSVIAARHGTEIERRMGNYELAERCPIVANRLHE